MLIGGIATHLQRAQLTPKSKFARLDRIIPLKPFWGIRFVIAQLIYFILSILDRVYFLLVMSISSLSRLIDFIVHWS
ncbi:hypothetical protein C5167_043897 [Papaver somniferum]|uniref:Uncharacterized protein n=1 Tax=Papaver somniferum TaxID=3469 RepID=A0A4Y7L8N3_PAPSO|nr:hypothetical protein C5167_043897 [Papaver somniferum]